MSGLGGDGLQEVTLEGVHQQAWLIRSCCLSEGDQAVILGTTALLGFIGESYDTTERAGTALLKHADGDYVVFADSEDYSGHG